MNTILMQALMLVALIFITISIIWVKDLMVCIVEYCAFSFITMMLYNFMGAPDVAFTEAVIGVISTIIFIMMLRTINRRCK
ncbi:MAG: DUF4040 domain-containing protein [Clostridiales bacterium]|jgi:multicomponent Na+:H+ antiporter subunit B|nr:DUF4040 domain-containing protein [Clostridiales bacterium]